MLARWLIVLFSLLIFTITQAAESQEPAVPSQSPQPLTADAPAQSARRATLSELEGRSKAGGPGAQNELGLRYLRGVDVDKDPAQALLWFRKAASMGNAAACFNLGAAYYNGVGVQINDQEACKWFLLAFDAGSAEAKEALERCGRELPAARMTESEVLAGDAFLRGNDVKQNLSRALQAYQKAFAAGSGAAADRIGVMYADGLLFPQDVEQAIEWLNKAAKMGYVPAIYKVGLIYEKGSGKVTPDPKRAASLYRQAAQQGNPPAMMALGRLYASGIGVRQSNQEAYRWYYLAWKYDAPGAQEGEDSVAASLTPKQIADIKKGKR